ncbi:MAG TPA: tyrosine-type recombinase/integrase [Acidimicrobiales bacterium]|nr:tyrosine-type recombinase/integrase [Acidimicrobiales bacterium]
MSAVVPASVVKGSEVRVYALTVREGAGYSYKKVYKSPWVVKWSVGGCQRSKSFRTKDDADDWRSRLKVEVGNDEPFDAATGLPVKWLRHEKVPPDATAKTFLEHCVTHVLAKWPRWKPKSRCSGVEALVIACTTLTDEPLPDLLLDPTRSWLLHCALTPNPREPTPPEVAASNWLVQHSLPLGDLRAKHVEATLNAMAERLDGGGRVASTTLARRRNVLNHCLSRAERDELLLRNPVRTVDRSALTPTTTVDPAATPDLRQAHALIDHIDKQGKVPRASARKRETCHRYATFLTVVLLSGMRPSEVRNLQVNHLDLPPQDWGTARVWGGTVAPGGHWTDTGNRFDDGSQKWRDPDAPPRSVPLSPELVTILRDHIKAEGRQGRLFVNGRGNPLSIENMALRRAWDRARRALHPPVCDKLGALLPRRAQLDPLFGVVPYDLRHTAASVMIAAGLPPAEVARVV